VGEIIIPEDLTDYYAGGIAVDPVRKLLAVVIDWDNRRDPCPKPFGGKRESWDASPMETARREGKEEINFDLSGPGKLIFYCERRDHGSCLFRWDLSSQEFDEQAAQSRREHELGGKSKILHVMPVQEVLVAGPKQFVSFYKAALEPELFRIMAE
jgi:8-oxo-dGTP pyrophosphatase MutT (NUDIX family)